VKPFLVQRNEHFWLNFIAVYEIILTLILVINFLFPRHFSEETLESAGSSLDHLVTFFIIYMGYV